jgi:hypothetical protein
MEQQHSPRLQDPTPPFPSLENPASSRPSTVSPSSASHPVDDGTLEDDPRLSNASVQSFRSNAAEKSHHRPHPSPRSPDGVPHIEPRRFSTPSQTSPLSHAGHSTTVRLRDSSGSPTASPNDGIESPGCADDSTAESPGAFFLTESPVSQSSFDDGLIENDGPASMHDSMSLEIQHSKAPQRESIAVQKSDITDSSPATATRPRPESTPYTYSRSTTPSRPSTPVPLRHSISSRIPVVDSNKARLVEIKPRRTATPPFTNERRFSHGSRFHCASSPRANPIFGQKHQHESPANQRSASASTSSSRLVHSPHGWDSSLSEEPRLITPDSEPFPTYRSSISSEFEWETSDGPGPLDIPRSRRAPPSNSRHTSPLQTIPSQRQLHAFGPERQRKTPQSWRPAPRDGRPVNRGPVRSGPSQATIPRDSTNVSPLSTHIHPPPS